jgi:iron complex outermembrane receptor protein
VFANLKYELADDINFSVKGIWNERKSKNQAAPLPFGVGAGRGHHAGARHDRHRRHQPVQSVRRDARRDQYDFILRRFVEGGPRASTRR